MKSKDYAARLNTIIECCFDGKQKLLAEKLNISTQLVGDWKRRNAPNFEIILDILCNISAEWLMRGKGKMLIDSSKKAWEEPEQHEEPASLAYAHTYADNTNVSAKIEAVKEEETSSEEFKWMMKYLKDQLLSKDKLLEQMQTNMKRILEITEKMNVRS